jgi:hypothetical protein
MRTGRATLALAVLASLVLFAGCGRVSTLDTVWPEAVSERSVPRPPGPPRWPLTGLDAPDANAITTRIVSVKIENSPSARPQVNLDKADVVYETVTEGGITRFNALYQSQSPKSVAPVRSARASDLSVVPQYGALFAHVGGDREVKSRIKSTHIDDMDQSFNSSAYWRGSDRRAPHNMYVDVGKLRSLAIRKRQFDASQTLKPFPFDRTAAPTTVTVSAISVPFSASNKVGWGYNGSKKTYVRSINGKKHVDKVGGKAYEARNVVVMWAPIRLWRKRDVAGSPVYNIILTGSGKAAVFRNGQRYNGTWTAGTSAPPVFKDKNGGVIRLSPGVTWFQVIGTNQSISTEK